MRNDNFKGNRANLRWTPSMDGEHLQWTSTATNARIFSYETGIGRPGMHAKNIEYKIKIADNVGTLYAFDYEISSRELAGTTVDGILLSLKRIAEVHRRNRENSQLKFEKMKKTLGYAPSGERVIKEVYEASGPDKYYEIFKDNNDKWMARVGDKKNRFLNVTPENLLNKYGEAEFEFLVSTCNHNNSYYHQKRRDEAARFAPRPQNHGARAPQHNPRHQR